MRVFEIEKQDHLGRGIVKDGDKIIFVLDAIIGDCVEIEIIKEKKKYSVARIKSLVKKSDLRCDNFCEYQDICGGCNIGNMSYKAQLSYKEEKIRNIVGRYLNDDIKINPIIYSKNFNYRNKLTLHVAGKKIGLFEQESNKLVEIDKCFLVDDKINELIPRLRDFIRNVEHSLKEIVIKVTSLKEVMLVFYGEVKESDVMSYFSDVNSLFIGETALKDNYITEKIGDFKFLMSASSFFQVNLYNTVNLYNEVIRLMADKKYNKVLDLYCGTGTIGMFASCYAKEVIGVEVVKDAISAANRNKEINGRSNIKFLLGKVENYIDKFNDIDLIIVDPPRSGLDKKTVNNILRIGPKEIIYVSCDPMTLVRDLNLLKEDYKIEELTPVDMFPNTHHVECVSVLHRKQVEK